MTQSKGEGSWLDVAAFTERVMASLEPMIEEAFNRHGQESLDRQSISWMNLQVQKQREYREQRDRRAHREQPRFVGNQDAPDPYMPPGGALNDVRVELNGVKGAVGEVLQLARGSFEHDAMVSTRLDSIELTLKRECERLHQQLAYIHQNNAWLELSEPEEEEEVEVPDD